MEKGSWRALVQHEETLDVLEDGSVEDGTSEDENLSFSIDPELIDSSEAISMRKLEMKESVYDDAFLSPMIAKTGHSYRSWLLLALNFFLQFMVLMRVGFMVEGSFHDVKDSILGQGGCAWIEENEYPHTAMIGKPPTHMPRGMYLDCVSNEVFFMFNFSRLDLDGDGYWSPEEAKRLEKKWFGSGFRTQMQNVLFRILFSVKSSANLVKNMSAYGDNPHVREQALAVLRLLNDANGSLPYAVFSSQVRPFMDMCVLMDPALCGNLLFRRSLNRSVLQLLSTQSGFQGAPLAFLERAPHAQGELRDLMDLCTVTINEICPSFFTVSYNVHSKTRKEMCGKSESSQKKLPEDAITSEWDRLTQILLVEEFKGFETYERQMSWMYQLLLLLILLLWGIAMLEEFRTLVHWWRVLLGRPEHDVNYKGKGSDERTVDFSEISNTHRIMTVVLNLIPRTCISCVILVYGALYLVLSPGYSDLMMNSLALTFLITIDEMIYAAMVPSRRKQWIAQSEPMVAKPNKYWDRVVPIVLNEFFLVTLAFGVVICFMLYEYRKRWGKIDLTEIFQCMCQVEGYDCLGANLLGGYGKLRDAPGIHL